MANIPLPSVITQLKEVTVSAPGAGVDWSFVVPAGKWWMLFSAYAVLTQGITQTPQPILQIDDGTNVIMESIGSSAVQAVSTTTAYTWGPGFVQSGQVGSGAGVHSVAPIPDGLILLAGYHVKSSTLGIGANSQWSVPRLYLAELG